VLFSPSPPCFFFFPPFFRPFRQTDAISTRASKKRGYDIYCPATSRDFATPARRTVTFSNVSINFSLEVASIASREINTKSPIERYAMQAMRINKECRVQCTRDVRGKRDRSVSPAGFDLREIPSRLFSTSRSSDVLVTITSASCASECNYNFIQINFRRECFILLITSSPRKRPSAWSRLSVSSLSRVLLRRSASSEFWTFR